MEVETGGVKHCMSLLLAPLLLAGCHTPAPVAFNVPSLIGLNISQIRATLGKDVESESPVGMPSINGMVLLEEAWAKDDVVLRVDYDNTTGKVLNFFMPYVPKPNGGGFDPQLVREQGGLEEGSPKYRTELVNPNFEGPITPGVRIVPN